VSTPARNADRIARHGAGLRLAQSQETATRSWEPERIDGALDGLVATVDDLVRDLGESERTERFVGPDRGGMRATLRRKAVACLVVIAVIAFEFVVVSWFVSNL
jgi:hypothetical protein